VGSGEWKAIFARTSLKFFGGISYGLYLVEMLAFDVVDRVLGRWGLLVSRTSGSFTLVLARFAAGAALAVAVAYLSRWYYEEPFLQLKNRFGLHPIKRPGKETQNLALETKAAS
jgi:peptidoglycan/LPS O-acetylase OafA/YrhL